MTAAPSPAHDCDIAPAVVVRVTERQRQVLAFVHSYTEQHGRPPLHAEVAVALGMSSKSLATGHIQALIQRGLLDHKRRSPRSLQVSILGKDVLGITTDASARALERCRLLLSLAADLLGQTTPNAPLLAEIRREIG
jgi:SOS-response transcriptional repressor LexA